MKWPPTPKGGFGLVSSGNLLLSPRHLSGGDLGVALFLYILCWTRFGVLVLLLFVPRVSPAVIHIESFQDSKIIVLNHNRNIVFLLCLCGLIVFVSYEITPNRWRGLWISIFSQLTLKVLFRGTTGQRKLIRGCSITYYIMLNPLRGSCFIIVCATGFTRGYAHWILSGF